MKSLARRAYRALTPEVQCRIRGVYRHLPRSWQTAIRLRFVWPTSASAEMTRAYVRRNGLTVRRGPFVGLTYPTDLIGRVDQLVPKLTGAYEAELHPAVERLAAKTVVNIGSADGYYAVGLALKGSTVYAFDPDRVAQKACRRLAAANGVQIRYGGAVTPGVLRRLHLDGALIVCDCEGCEDSVLVPEALRTCALIVELHDFVRRGLGAAVIRRFSATHNVEVIEQQDRDASDFAELSGIPHADLAVAEDRPERMRWVVMTPREAIDDLIGS